MGQLSIFHVSLSFICLVVALVLTLLYFGRKLFDADDQEVSQLRTNPVAWFFYRISLITWVFFRRLQLYANYFTTTILCNFFPKLAAKLAQFKYARLSEEDMAVELRATSHVYLLLLADLNELRADLDPESLEIAEQSLRELKTEYFRKKSIFVRTYPNSTEEQGYIPD